MMKNIAERPWLLVVALLVVFLGMSGAFLAIAIANAPAMLR